MLDDYKLKGPSKKIEIDIEIKVAETLTAMAGYSKLTPSEIANTALKRFIAAHKDFLPPSELAPKKS